MNKSKLFDTVLSLLTTLVATITGIYYIIKGEYQLGILIFIFAELVTVNRRLIDKKN